MNLPEREKSVCGNGKKQSAQRDGRPEGTGSLKKHKGQVGLQISEKSGIDHQGGKKKWGARQSVEVQGRSA